MKAEPKTAARDARAERLAKALRDNLRRRKQAKPQAAQAKTPTDTAP